MNYCCYYRAMFFVSSNEDDSSPYFENQTSFSYSANWSRKLEFGWVINRKYFTCWYDFNSDSPCESIRYAMTIDSYLRCNAQEFFLLLLGHCKWIWDRHQYDREAILFYQVDPPNLNSHTYQEKRLFQNEEIFFYHHQSTTYLNKCG